MCTSSDDHLQIPCSHEFSVVHLRLKCMTPKKEENMLTHFTVFNSHGEFMNKLQFLLPNLDRKLLIYWDSEARKILPLLQKQCLMVIVMTLMSLTMKNETKLVEHVLQHTNCQLRMSTFLY